MSQKIDDGGPAFACPNSTTTEGVCENHHQPGMSLRDYLAAHAPEAPDWFQPTTPPKPKSVWVHSEVPGMTYDTPREALQACKEVHGYENDEEVSDQNAQARRAWEDMREKEKVLQWPYAYADAVLARRGVK